MNKALRQILGLAARTQNLRLAMTAVSLILLSNSVQALAEHLRANFASQRSTGFKVYGVKVDHSSLEKYDFVGEVEEHRILQRLDDNSVSENRIKDQTLTTAGASLKVYGVAVSAPAKARFGRQILNSPLSNFELGHAGDFGIDQRLQQLYSKLHSP